MASSSNIPRTMAGILIEKTGGTGVLQYRTDLPVPQPKEGELLVKNEYIGVNYIDTYFRSGLYPPPSFPYILGREGSGIVVASGGGQTYNLNPSDRIVYLNPSCYAEYACVSSLKALKLPQNISSADATASLLQGLTALTMIRESYPVQKGDWVLVHAAAGGVGLWLCQLLHAIGAHTVATASTAEKRELACVNKADEVVSYNKKEVLAKVHSVTNGKGVVAVFDGVGKATFDLSLECLARKGTMVSFGNASGAVPPFTITNLAPKNLKLLRPSLFNYMVTREEFEQYTSELLSLIAEHNIDIRIHEIYPLKEVARAHGDLEGRKTTGKLLLRP